MSLSLYNLLESGQTGFDLAGYATGGYTLTGTFLDALNSFTVSLISFVDMTSYVDEDNKGELDWLVKLSSIANTFHPATPPVNNVLIMAVLYNNGGNVADPDGEYAQAFSRVGLTPGNLRYFVQKNDFWVDGTMPGMKAGPANAYRAGFAPSPPNPALTGAFSYLLYKTFGGQFRVVDKVHTASADSGSGDAGEKISFTGWTPNYANLQAYIVKRINDHLETTPEATVFNPPAYIGNGSTITVQFPEKAIGAGDQGNFIIKDGSSSISGLTQPPNHSDVSVSAYIEGTSQENTVLTFQNLDLPPGYNNHTLSIELVTGLTDTSGEQYALTSAVSFIVDTVAPVVIVDGPFYTNVREISITARAPSTPDVTHWFWKVDDSIAPNPNASGWESVDNPTAGDSLPVTLPDSDGLHDVWVWAKDAAGNVSNGYRRQVHLDRVRPTVNSFQCSDPSDSGYVSVSSIDATDETGGSGIAFYLATFQPQGSAVIAPLQSDGRWTGTSSFSFNLGSYGSYTLYAWAKDRAGNVSPVTASSQQNLEYSSSSGGTCNRPLGSCRFGPIPCSIAEACGIQEFCALPFRCKIPFSCDISLTCNIPQICRAPFECTHFLLKCPPRILPDCRPEILISDCLHLLDNIQPGWCPSFDPSPIRDLADILKNAVREGGIDAFDAAIKSEAFKTASSRLPKEALRPIASMIAAIRMDLQKSRERRDGKRKSR